MNITGGSQIGRMIALEKKDLSPKRFVEELLLHAGGKLKEKGGGVYEASFPPELKKRLGRRRMRVRFEKGPGKKLGLAEPLIAGNPFFEEMLSYAQESGAVTRRYAASDEEKSAAEIAGRVKFRNFRPALKIGKMFYSPWIAFYFRLTLSSYEMAEKQATLYYDSFTRTISEDGHPGFHQAAWSETPDNTLPVARTRNHNEIFSQVLEVLCDRIRPDVSSFRRQALESFENEARRFSLYYKELISEERERQRSFRGRVEDSGGDIAERIVQHKVDWERKLSHEARRIEPKASVSLLAVEEFYVPITRVELSWKIDRLAFRGIWGYDVVRGDIVGNLCKSCGVKVREAWSCSKGHVVCARCHKKCSLCEAGIT
ncbi:MAG: hypothetical protein QME66_10625 [Candidatus Eisenbacteria bacterium]|nr:hypothetical protein [Candidatus Eisenbacteria bacterium]